MIKYLSILIFIIVSIQNAKGQNINIGLFYKNDVYQAVFEPIRGRYIIVGDSSIFDIKAKELIYLSVEGMKVKVRTIKKEIGFFDKVIIEKRQPTRYDEMFRKRKIDSIHIFRLNPLQKDVAPRFYDDELKITVANDRLTLINDVDFDKYLAGVVEAEAGANALPEFYKAQATICRTYAVQNAHKHKGERFQLCDDVDCQAFKGRSTRNDEILRAVKATHGLVIMDTDSTYINAVFSANCGGQTLNAEYLWNVPKTYLKSVADPHCITEQQAFWTKEINTEEWKKYLRDCGLKIPDNAPTEAFTFNQNNRLIDYKCEYGTVALKQIRTDWRLRSAFFSLVPENGKLTFKGRGYGHGVGMCQEGAMNMAVKGFTFDSIIEFYYKDVKIKKLKQ